MITYEALNAAGDVGTGSAQVSAGNHQHIPGQPSPPGASTPTGDSGRTQIALTWTAPYAGSSGITSYTLAYSEHDANSWTEVSVTGRNYTVASLDHSTNYDFRVRARNSAGAGPFSEITSQATQSANAPGVPTSVSRGGVGPPQRHAALSVTGGRLHLTLATRVSAATRSSTALLERLRGRMSRESLARAHRSLDCLTGSQYNATKLRYAPDRV